ncbi:MAG TPA: hypothetical protein VNK46_06825 [Nitrospiraceae bacterium]|jgi:hypothetical protein|nr:hypothetical protein [Nitrospiraceae bacterium]
MADTIRTAQYFKVQVPDKPGIGAGALTMLRDAGVNLLAFSAFPRGRRSQMDFVPSDPEAFKTAAKRAKWKLVAPKTCFLIEGDDRPGALVDVLTQLAGAKINVTALDAVVAGSGRYGAIFWVKPRDVKKAAKLLGAM